MNIFDKMIQDSINENLGNEMLDECMAVSGNDNKQVPLRYRLIAKGFIRGYGLEKMNGVLMKNGCARLYSRNIWEATLIYAFLNAVGYDEWKTLVERLHSDQRLKVKMGGDYFSGAITFRKLEKYVKGASVDKDMRTINETKKLDRKLKGSSVNDVAFYDFLLDNISIFSTVREKSRYYFCKYLYYMLLNALENIIASEKMGIRMANVADSYLGSDGMVDERNAFKCLTKLSRHRYSEMEMREVLEESGISCGTIYDGFNQFYYDYSLLDWMDVLMEEYDGISYGNIRDLHEEERKKLAAAAIRYRSEWADLSNDMEVISHLLSYYRKKDNEKDFESEKEFLGMSQKSRHGENTVRKYIKGELDLNRTSLICFLLYFGERAEYVLPEKFLLTKERLSEILLECGYAALREDDGFDFFVEQFLEADDRLGLLMNEVTSYALENRNSPLFQVYRSQGSHYEQIRKLIFGRQGK